MPQYQFSCRSCGGYVLTFAMAAVPRSCACPSCGTASPRKFGGAALIRPGSPAVQLIDSTKRTATDPAVVSAPPSRSSRRISQNPMHRNLPRP